MGFTKADIQDLPTLCKGHSQDLKIETERLRVWLCRVSGQVEIERLKNGRWETED